MPHVLETAPSARAKCRGCGERIAGGELRFGERLPNPFAEGDAEMTHWFHLLCAVYRRPEPVIETLEAVDEAVPNRDDLLREARLGVERHRLPRLSTAERASSGRAACRSCRDPIAKDTWRISLVFHEDGRFTPAGFVHIACAPAYFETPDIMSRVKHFSKALTDAELADIRAQLPA